MTQPPEHIAGVTTHSRRGEIRHRFRYGVDYVLIDPDAPAVRPWLFSRNRFNLASVHDCDHGGPIKAGRGAAWAREVLAAHGLDVPRLPAHGLAGRAVQLGLLTQPRFLGYVFNPVSFWLAEEQGALIAVIAEVSTPFGDRHSYLCHLPDFAPITKDSRITAPKALHVSPFQEVKGSYEFSFDIRPDRLAIRILHRNGDEGVIATLSGPRVPLSNAGLVRASLRRPLGALRTSLLIYWQALRLKLKGARYRTRPTPPNSEVT
ncbi:DUF1365 domain-containing protein [Antarcticimicrobium sediminis]|uniref:DUF1365 domain-containing protein n=1 Tax=Antarcticimicrobium sediminis TaxID=2546227 RepID=A0A4R5F0T0_9RHOB|nr:DUF1365 domain-containing protein [Antarcticimicrobium sediminis]TDE41095.1 DUF1365 domain-containing protein [Antarcticimicrobium sediminis]